MTTNKRSAATVIAVYGINQRIWAVWGGFATVPDLMVDFLITGNHSGPFAEPFAMAEANE